jgi:hypothetical protein
MLKVDSSQWQLEVASKDDMTQDRYIKRLYYALLHLNIPLQLLFHMPINLPSPYWNFKLYSLAFQRL